MGKTKATVSRSRYYGIISLLVILTAVGTTGGYLFGRQENIGEKVTEYRLTSDVQRGHSLKGKYQTVEVSVEDAINESNIVTSEDELQKAVALHDLYENQIITKTAIGIDEDVDRNLEFDLPTDVGGTLANSIQEGDIVAIKVKYEDSRTDACVLSKVRVSRIKTEDGTELSEDESTPGFLIMYVKNDELNKLNDASKEGTLYCVRYKDVDGEMLQENYEKGKDPVTGEAVETDNSL